MLLFPSRTYAQEKPNLMFMIHFSLSYRTSDNEIICDQSAHKPPYNICAYGPLDLEVDVTSFRLGVELNLQFFLQKSIYLGAAKSLQHLDRYERERRRWKLAVFPRWYKNN